MKEAVTTRFLSPSSPEWTATLGLTTYDFSHLPSITELAAREEGGEATAFFAEGAGATLLIPLILRRVPEPTTHSPNASLDAISAYGYPSPLLVGQHESAGGFLASSLQAFVGALRTRGVIAAFVRLHPLLDFPTNALAQVGHLVYHGDTVSVDLRISDDQIWRNTSGFHRRSIDRARRLGYTGKMDSEWRHLDSFLEIYEETMDRVSAAGLYRFSPRYFTDLREALGERGHLTVVEYEGEIVAAGIITEVCGIVQMFLAGSRSAHLRASPAKVLEDFVRSWAKRRGNRWYHLGGGVGAARDSLFDFKLGFSQLTHPFSTWRVVADPDAYCGLVQEWEVRTGLTADNPAGFFPAYRKAVPESLADPQRESD